MKEHYHELFIPSVYIEELISEDQQWVKQFTKLSNLYIEGKIKGEEYQNECKLLLEK